MTTSRDESLDAVRRDIASDPRVTARAPAPDAPDVSGHRTVTTS